MNATREVMHHSDWAHGDWPRAGFPGLAINPETLLAEVVDEELCERALALSTEVNDRILVLLARRRHNEAADLLVEARMAEHDSLSLQILEADAAGAAHDLDRAIKLLQHLAREYRGTPDEAAVLQHLVKATFRAGRYRAAASFAVALDLRVAAGDSASLIYSSTVALQRARDLSERSASVA
ncbi:conserved hypothetical protein [Renibacterium salmoninarum ATCC 33209]|uniref:Uncharacterized protein n=1 Tax=Renibacterium salmoninarum (strain ATCC 33209 / DSM 20767 / JCM 11484 / NBRC 15589 / NCIMB 2235) TaxID=288705 RepID=A9WSB7_RENSM|nr:hypothetical protein [Renibacterium salmoninarum]ABY23705.1 conserved hypothetical protein [Renibacterium salmoninarum ATCC 33209]